jgi:5-amino-6-(5-phosphoribosylamino)uracil reductase/diaminohydroxyphosphoribosylaminopyrimidine deaminase/5-amino-6-(5-phosphoribosylamino)uracil reductase
MPHRPYVTLAFAQSIDGRIATITGESQWISGEETLSLSQEIRAASDAILVGVGTVIRDDPRLTCRLPGSPSPLRVILDGRLRVPLSSTILRTASEYPTVVFTGRAETGDVGPDRSTTAVALRGCGAEVRTVPSGGGSYLDLRAVLDDLASRGVQSIMVEGGSAVITSFIRQRVVDRMVIVSAPVLIGRGTDAVGDLGVTALSDAVRGKTVRVRQMGQDIVWEVEFERN